MVDKGKYYEDFVVDETIKNWGYLVDKVHYELAKKIMSDYSTE